jgi:cysteinyl-tRNA synthetase
MALRIYNTLTRQTELFVPLEPGKVSMYVCGPTVYADAHIGHAMAAIIFDTVRRYLTYRGYAVKFVTNFTDVDDKIIRRANEQGRDPLELANHYAKKYFRHLSDLNVLPAHVYPRVSQEMSWITQMITGLEEEGYAYRLDGDVYFRVTNDGDYGKLSGRTLEEAIERHARRGGCAQGAPRRLCAVEGAKPGEPAWPSPWAPGVRAGTSSAPPCACITWARWWTSTAAATT